MASRKTARKKKSVPRPRLSKPAARPARSTKCFCGSSCHDEHARLPGYLLIALGIMAVPLNFGMLPSMDWAKAWPLLLVLFGFVMVVRATLCRRF
ncbi:MAG: DUF5668 domain-containing protein [Candidatus Micrarchaeota archaeon]